MTRNSKGYLATVRDKHNKSGRKLYEAHTPNLFIAYHSKRKAWPDWSKLTNHERDYWRALSSIEGE